MGTVWSAVVMCRAGLSDGLMWSARVGRAQVVSKKLHELLATNSTEEN